MEECKINEIGEKIIPLNIVTSYPVRWGKYQVIRDFVQNFYDSVGYSKWCKKFQYDYLNDTLSVWIDDITFNYEWLLHIGASTKTAKSRNYAGYFGEGFKIASLCAKRDFRWEIEMQSGDWNISVIFIKQKIDNQQVEMMAYHLEQVSHTNRSILKISNFSNKDYKVFLDTLESFFYPENKILGKKVWSGENGAVYLRSKEKIVESLPYVREYGMKGAVFCGYQMLGTNPFELVVCLHKYKKLDRERRTLYSFEVIDVFEDIANYIDAKGAMIMLEQMRKYWNTIPNKRIDIDSWSEVINLLVWKIQSSIKVTKRFVEKYPNLLYQKKITSIAAKNRRTQAREWLAMQDKKYVLVKETFQCLGYPSLEEVCAEHGGFVEEEQKLNLLEEKCFCVLETVCDRIFEGFFIMDDLRPERRIIRNKRAVYHGMAVVYKNRESLVNNKGLAIKYDVKEIYLKKTLFDSNGFYDGMATYVHELCHMFGSDASNSFGLALTIAMEIMLANYDEIEKGRLRWKEIFDQIGKVDYGMSIVSKAVLP